MDKKTNLLAYTDFYQAFEFFLSQTEILSKMERLAQSGKKTLLLPVNGQSEFRDKKIRFIDSSYPAALATILNNHKQTEDQDTKKQLIDLLREQIQKGQFIFESKSSDGAIQAITTPLIAQKLEKGELKLISNKDHITEKKYDSIEQLDNKQLEELSALISVLDKPKELDASPAEQKAADENPQPIPTPEVNNQDVKAEVDSINKPLAEQQEGSGDIT